MDPQGSEEIDFENVTNKVTLLSVALTDITRQIERGTGAGATDLNAVSAQLANLHAKIGEDSLGVQPAAWTSHTDLHFMRCVSIQLTRVQRTLTAPEQKPRCRLYHSAFVTKLPLHKIRASIVANCKLTGLSATPNRPHPRVLPSSAHLRR